jgi:hypothetical protein
MKILVCSLVSAVATLALTTVLFYWSRLKKRAWDEYQPLLREFDWNEAKILFDHEEEDRQRLIRDPKQFRRDQRARLDLAMELVGRRAYHNSRLSAEWNNTEWCDMIDYHLEYEPEKVEAMRTLRRETAAFRWIALLDLTYMWLLSLAWPIIPVPSIAARRKVFSADVLQSYERVRQAAANFARLAYSEEEAQLVLTKM